MRGTGTKTYRTDNRLSALAELVDQLTARAQAGEVLDPELLAEEYPEYADDLRRLLPALGLLGELSRSRESLGLVVEGDAVAGTLGDYRIVREVGRGGMGVVYEAEQISLRRRVALKVLPFAAVMDPRHLQRFRNEALAAASLDHPNVVKVYGVGCERGVHFIALQYIDGRTLADLIRERRGDAPPAGSPGVTRSFAPDDTSERPAAPPPPLAGTGGSRTPADAEYVRRVAEWGTKAAEALEHAHALGVVHRDVKPGNLLVDGRGELYVADFGLAKMTTDPGMTGTGDVLGTLRFMSPEQAGAKHDLVDHRSDVYSLGVTLYELLTLTPAFAGENRAQLLHRVLTTDPAAPRSVERSIPLDVETVVLKAIDKDPARRYQSAKELAEDLRRFLDRKPVTARRASLAERTRRWVRRHPTTVAAAAAVLFVSAAALAIVLAVVDRERGRTKAALGREQEARQAVEREQAETRAALGREQAALEQTNRRLEQIENGVEILGSIFANLDPESEEKEGKPLRQLLADQLDKAAEELRGEAVGDPLVVAKLQHILGNSLAGLGEAAKAVELLREAEATRTALLGYDHPQTLDSRNSLACAYRNARRLDLAIPLFERNLKASEVRLGGDNPNTLTSRQNLAEAYRVAGKLDLAIPLFERTLNVCEAKLGDDHPQTLLIRDLLGKAHRESGSLSSAVSLLQKAVEGFEDTLGNDHIRTLTSRDNLAEAYQAAGKLELAVPLLESTSEAYGAKLGDDHPSTLRCRHNLARVYQATGKLDLAIPLFERTLNVCEAKLGETHPDTLTCRNSLGEAYRATGRLDLAIPLLKRTLEAYGTKMGDDHPHTHIFRNNLAGAYQAAGKLDLAIPLFERTLEAFEAKWGDDHPQTLLLRNNLAGAYRAAGKLDLAVPLFERTLEAFEAKLGDDHPDTLASRSNLAEAYLVAGKPDLALPLVATNVAMTRKVLPGGDPRLGGVLSQYGLILLQANKPIKAEPILRECLAIRAKRLPDAWNTFNARSMLGGALLGQKKYADAEPLLVSGYEGMKQRVKTIPPPGLIRLPEAVDRLIALYTALDRPAEVEKWRAERAKYPPPRAPRPRLVKSP